MTAPEKEPVHEVLVGVGNNFEEAIARMRFLHEALLASGTAAITALESVAASSISLKESSLGQPHPKAASITDVMESFVDYSVALKLTRDHLEVGLHTISDMVARVAQQCNTPLGAYKSYEDATQTTVSHRRVRAEAHLILGFKVAAAGGTFSTSPDETVDVYLPPGKRDALLESLRKHFAGDLEHIRIHERASS